MISCVVLLCAVLLCGVEPHMVDCTVLTLQVGLSNDKENHSMTMIKEG